MGIVAVGGATTRYHRVAAGILVIYIVSNATQQAGATEPVVVVTQHIGVGQTLSASVMQSDLVIMNYLVSDVPAGAYNFTTQDALNVKLASQVATQNLYPGDVLLASDRIHQQRLSSSITSLGTIPTGSVVSCLTTATCPRVGKPSWSWEHIDIIVSESGSPWYANGCETQTTFRTGVYATSQCVDSHETS